MRRLSVVVLCTSASRSAMFSVLKFAAVAVASAIKAIVAFAATHPVLFLMTFALMRVQISRIRRLQDHLSILKYWPL